MFTERQSSRNYSQCEMGSLKKKFLSFTATSAASSSPSVSMMTVYSVTNGKAEVFVCAVVSCRICFDEYGVEDLYTLENCGCRFCFSCMKRYLEVMIADGNVSSITCPDACCKRNGLLAKDEIKKLVGGPLFERYTRLRFEREVNLDPQRTFCSRAGCETVCHLTSPSEKLPAFGDTNPRPVRCPSCQYVFCAVCKGEWHDRKTCDESMRAESDGIPFSSAEDASIKRCPICRVPIERNDGCAQMMCKQCKHVFCWYCLTSLDDDFLLRHYDKGKCKNRLGHSRASVIWHRTQVVGIFAGFGVLLLVASPFLLLAAPCILCCKCKPCRYGEDEEGDTMPSTTT